ncbi:E3 ubiquitin-protein ligase parkin isoform X2 [Aethina tumida]|uniref:E3 ubiquitin-protein ligase parkin isoform X2 n=1 Tax=Aethina tumida TaxID=116153 RepID=UPI00096B5D45|nr:E3 ubiquitin-protein ligase parkin isoform X2 [Aethina tumida]
MMLQLLWFGKKTISNNLNIYIKTSTGNTLTVDLDPNWDIKNVKEIVAPQLGLQPEEVKIIFAGKELGDKITIAECDLGQQSILHAVKVRRKSLPKPQNSFIDEEEENVKPLCETLTNVMFSNEQNNDEVVKNGSDNVRVHFYVFCPTCKSLKTGKLRVRCHFCKSGAFTVHSDPQNWNDVLEPKQITGLCENDPELCEKLLDNREPTFAEFYFKCSEHASLGEEDGAVPLYLIRPNLRDIPCLACGDTSDPVFVFPCAAGHVTCLDCFRQYCITRLRERQFWQHPEYGYTLACPTGCADSFIKEIHHFRLLTDEQYAQYQRFATEEFVIRSGGVLCPQPGCGMGILIDPDCTKVTCVNGCGYVFCRLCLQGYHIGDCETNDSNQESDAANCSYNVDPARAATSRWDEASKVTIKVLTKPCPKCRTPTERDGGCMHMTCTRAGCAYDWCWVCQTEWTRECMGSHWFG